MSLKTLVVVGIVAIGSQGCAASQPSSDVSSKTIAETVYHNGFVYTVDTTRSTAQAFAVFDGKFIAVGTDDSMKAVTGPGTMMVDLGGQMVLPGIADCHIHPVRGGLTAQGVSFPSSASLEEVKKAVKDHIEKTKAKPGDWIEGAKWGTALLETLTATELDEISPDNPVYLHDWTNHLLAVNTKALEAAKITKDTKDPDAGKIYRDGSGNPTGILEDTAASLVTNIIPPPEEKAIRAAATSVFADLSRFGVTSIATAQLDANRLKVYRAMESDGELPVRIKGHWDYNTRFADAPPDEMAKRFATRKERGPVTDFIDPDGVKIYLDGVPSGYSSPYIDPYDDKPTFGTQSIDAPHLNTAMLAFDREGLQVMMHAVGDMAVRHALDAVEAARKSNGSGVRHHLAHAMSVHEEDLGRAGQLNVAVEISPWNIWAPDAGSLTFAKYLGRERMMNISPFKDLLAAGDVVCYGSDWDNVPDPNPWFAMECAITRANPDHPEFGQLGPLQAIDLPAAIEVFTINGAFNLGKEEITGSIEVGKSADFVVIDQNLFKVPVTEIHKTTVRQTVLMGKTVYKAQ